MKRIALVVCAVVMLFVQVGAIAEITDPSLLSWIEEIKKDPALAAAVAKELTITESGARKIKVSESVKVNDSCSFFLEAYEFEDYWATDEHRTRAENGYTFFKVTIMVHNETLAEINFQDRIFGRIKVGGTVDFETDVMWHKNTGYLAALTDVPPLGDQRIDLFAKIPAALEKSSDSITVFIAIDGQNYEYLLR